MEPTEHDDTPLDDGPPPAITPPPEGRWTRVPPPPSSRGRSLSAAPERGEPGRGEPASATRVDGAAAESGEAPEGAEPAVEGDRLPEPGDEVRDTAGQPIFAGPKTPGEVPPAASGAGAGHDARPRRRRSGGRDTLYPLPSDIPADAPGRVALSVGPTPRLPAPAGPARVARSADRPSSLVTALSDGWIAVVLLGAILVVVFLTGLYATR